VSSQGSPPLSGSTQPPSSAIASEDQLFSSPGPLRVDRLRVGADSWPVSGESEQRDASSRSDYHARSTGYIVRLSGSAEPPSCVQAWLPVMRRLINETQACSGERSLAEPAVERPEKISILVEIGGDPVGPHLPIERLGSPRRTVAALACGHASRGAPHLAAEPAHTRPPSSRDASSRRLILRLVPPGLL
jgi:hypothetical protein